MRVQILPLIAGSNQGNEVRQCHTALSNLKDAKWFVIAKEWKQHNRKLNTVHTYTEIVSSHLLCPYHVPDTVLNDFHSSNLTIIV